jgi:hypothetical protein
MVELARVFVALIALFNGLERWGTAFGGALGPARSDRPERRRDRGRRAPRRIRRRLLSAGEAAMEARPDLRRREPLTGRVDERRITVRVDRLRCGIDPLDDDNGARAANPQLREARHRFDRGPHGRAGAAWAATRFRGPSHAGAARAADRAGDRRQRRVGLPVGDTALATLHPETQRRSFPTDVANLPLRPPCHEGERRCVTRRVALRPASSSALGTGLPLDVSADDGGPRRTPGASVELGAASQTASTRVRSLLQCISSLI